MTRPTLEVADILHVQGDRFLDRYRSSFNFQQLKALRAIGKVLYETSGWMNDVRISPDGTQVAFIEHPLVPDDRGAVALVDRQGAFRRLTTYYATGRSLCWTPDGKEVWYTASLEGEDPGMYAVTPGAKTHTVLRVADRIGHSRYLSGRQGPVTDAAIKTV